MYTCDTDFSEPHFCPELDVALDTAEFRGLSVEDQRRFELEVVVSCREKMLAEGIDFSAYDSGTSACDLGVTQGNADARCA